MALPIGAALRHIRLFHDMKANKLAEALRTSKSYISEIENNKKQPPLELINRYVAYFKIPTSSIFLFAENIAAGAGKAGSPFERRKMAFQFLNSLTVATAEEE